MAALGLMPYAAAGQELPQGPSAEPLLYFARNLFELTQQLLPLVVSLALLAFFWGVIRFILNINRGADSKEAGRGVLVWGVIALFVMVSIWGIVRFLQDTLGIESVTEIQVPGI